MNPIEHDLLQSKNHKKKSKCQIDLYHYTNELYNELISLNIIDRMKEIPQLGLIRVKEIYQNLDMIILFYNLPS